MMLLYWMDVAVLYSFGRPAAFRTWLKEWKRDKEVETCPPHCFPNNSKYHNNNETSIAPTTTLHSNYLKQQTVNYVPLTLVIMSHSSKEPLVSGSPLLWICNIKNTKIVKRKGNQHWKQKNRRTCPSLISHHNAHNARHTKNKFSSTHKNTFLRHTLQSSSNFNLAPNGIRPW